jgi:hypothetical protein
MPHRRPLPSPRWIWAYWINPYAWGLRALAINEFHSSAWDDLVSDPNNPTGPVQPLGIIMLGLYDVYTDFAWVWYGVVSARASRADQIAVPWNSAASSYSP